MGKMSKDETPSTIPNKSLSATLQSKMEHLDRLWTVQNLMLINVPFQKDENIFEIVSKFCSIIRKPISTNSGISCFRVTSKRNQNPNDRQHPAPILIKFNNINQRNEIFTAYLESLKGDNPPNFINMGISVDPVRIYLNENLTNDSYKLFTMARHYKQKGLIFQTFTAYGLVYVRLIRDGRKIRVNSMSYLDSLIKNIKNGQHTSLAGEPNSIIQGIGK